MAWNVTNRCAIASTKRTSSTGVSYRSGVWRPVASATAIQNRKPISKKAVMRAQRPSASSTGCDGWSLNGSVSQYAHDRNAIAHTDTANEAMRARVVFFSVGHSDAHTDGTRSNRWMPRSSKCRGANAKPEACVPRIVTHKVIEKRCVSTSSASWSIVFTCPSATRQKACSAYVCAWMSTHTPNIVRRRLITRALFQPSSAAMTSRGASEWSSIVTIAVILRSRLLNATPPMKWNPPEDHQ
mmetsp:Transcript_8338/g.26023  ORF Transcript_8338/g.26023 Transcript_8338/m.26023 type:complete len:241 (-) Transcript_8338:16-738(-)